MRATWKINVSTESNTTEKQVIKASFKIKYLSVKIHKMYMAGQAWEWREIETEINKI